MMSRWSLGFSFFMRIDTVTTHDIISNMNTTIQIRTNKTLKLKAQKIFEKQGLTLSSAFNMYMADVVDKKVIPHSCGRVVPPALMQKWHKETMHALKKGKSYDSVDKLMADLNG